MRGDRLALGPHALDLGGRDSARPAKRSAMPGPKLGGARLSRRYGAGGFHRPAECEKCPTRRMARRCRRRLRDDRAALFSASPTLLVLAERPAISREADRAIGAILTLDACCQEHGHDFTTGCLQSAKCPGALPFSISSVTRRSQSPVKGPGWESQPPCPTGQFPQSAERACQNNRRPLGPAQRRWYDRGRGAPVGSERGT